MKSSLQKLMFGETEAVREASIDKLLDAWNLSSGTSYEPTTNDFDYKFAMTSINGIDLLACASTPTKECGEFEADTIIIGASGNFQLEYERKKVAVSNQLSYFPKGLNYKGECSTHSGVGLTFNKTKLNAIVRTMFPEMDVKIDWNSPNFLSTSDQGINFSTIFKNVLNQIDVYGNNVDLLGREGFDDVIYRHLAIALTLDISSVNNKIDTPSKAIGVACEYMRENYDRRITLSDLETVSGLSARNLQYHFSNIHQCSPLEWLRSLRLAQAHKQIIDPSINKSITEISYDCGFSSPSKFSQYYKQAYGVLPSEQITAV